MLDVVMSGGFGADGVFERPIRCALRVRAGASWLASSWLGSSWLGSSWLGSSGSGLPRPVAALSGEIDVAGLAARRALSGEVSLERRRLQYRFAFDDDRGRALAFAGDQDLSLVGVPPPLTVVRGTVRDGQGSIIGHAVLRLDLRTELRRGLERLRRMGR